MRIRVVEPRDTIAAEVIEVRDDGTVVMKITAHQRAFIVGEGFVGDPPQELFATGSTLTGRIKP